MLNALLKKYKKSKIDFVLLLCACILLLLTDIYFKMVIGIQTTATDVQTTALRLLTTQYPYVYNKLIEARNNNTMQRFYIDDRCDPKTFYTLLAVGNPPLFKQLYDSGCEDIEDACQTYESVYCALEHIISITDPVSHAVDEDPV